MRRFRSLFAVSTAAALLFTAGSLGTARPADAQSAQPCGTSGQLKRVEQIKKTLKEMSTTDPAVIDRNIKNYTEIVEHWRTMTPGEENPATRMYGDALDFWREKKAHEVTGGMVDVQSGKRWASYLQQQLDQLQGIVGSWNWWNGLTVTFSPGGGANYRGSASGTGSWQQTGGKSYHVHWKGGNTNDYFTLSSDGKKLEGTYDGKPGVSTRKC